MTRKERYAELAKRANKMLYAVHRKLGVRQLEETECAPNVEEARRMSVL